jgi:hypothetical protein
MDASCRRTTVVQRNNAACGVADCIRLPIVSKAYTLLAIANRTEKKAAAAA